MSIIEEGRSSSQPKTGKDYIYTIDISIIYIYHVGHMSTPIPVSEATQDTRTTLTQSAGMLDIINTVSYIKPLLYTM